MPQARERDLAARCLDLAHCFVLISQNCQWLVSFRVDFFLKRAISCYKHFNFSLILFLFRKVSASWTLVFIVSLIVEEAVSQMRTLVPFTAKRSQKMRDLKSSPHIKKRTNQIIAVAPREVKVRKGKCFYWLLMWSSYFLWLLFFFLQGVNNFYQVDRLSIQTYWSLHH